MTAKDLNQQQIGVTDFFSEGVIVSAVQRIEVRKVASAMGLPAKSGEEAEAVPVILERLQSEAQAAGGEAPLPAQPDTAIVRELRELAGNRQIVGVAEKADTLIDHHRDWSAAGEAAQRTPARVAPPGETSAPCSHIARCYGIEPSDGSDSVPTFSAD